MVISTQALASIVIAVVALAGLYRSIISALRAELERDISQIRTEFRSEIEALRGRRESLEEVVELLKRPTTNYYLD